jgi:hypothetical protein
MMDKQQTLAVEFSSPISDQLSRVDVELKLMILQSAFETCDAPPPTLAPNGTGLTPRKVVADLARMVFCY